jgi:phosphoglycerate dehydrogenase-like enzyme
LAAGGIDAPVAEFAQAAIFFALQRVWRFSRVVHARRDRLHMNVAGACGITVALISLGMIGRRLAVTLTPHIAGSMDGECRRMGRYMLEELYRFVAGKPLQWRITRERAGMLA